MESAWLLTSFEFSNLDLWIDSYAIRYSKMQNQLQSKLYMILKLTHKIYYARAVSVRLI